MGMNKWAPPWCKTLSWVHKRTYTFNAMMLLLFQQPHIDAGVEWNWDVWGKWEKKKENKTAWDFLFRHMLYVQTDRGEPWLWIIYLQTVALEKLVKAGAQVMLTKLNGESQLNISEFSPPLTTFFFSVSNLYWNSDHSTLNAFRYGKSHSVCIAASKPKNTPRNAACFLIPLSRSFLSGKKTSTHGV